MLLSGINTAIFKPHSTKAASTSKASKKGVPLGHILKTAGWSRASTFARFYNKPVTTEDNSFAQAVLSKNL